MKVHFTSIQCDKKLICLLVQGHQIDCMGIILGIFKNCRQAHIFALLFIVFTGILASISWADEAGRVSENVKDTPISQPQITPWGFDLAGMEKNIHPGDDFYQFANGTWQETAIIEANNWSQSPTRRLRKEARKQNLALIDQLGAQDWPDNSDEAKFLNLHASYLDRRRLNRLGAKPLAVFLRHIDSARSHDLVARKMGD